MIFHFLCPVWVSVYTGLMWNARMMDQIVEREYKKKIAVVVCV